MRAVGVVSETGWLGDELELNWSEVLIANGDWNRKACWMTKCDLVVSNMPVIEEAPVHVIE